MVSTLKLRHLTGVEMAKLMLTWKIKDDNACPICKRANGFTWIFDTASGTPMMGELIHPTEGVIWTLGYGSAAHEHGRARGACRCNLIPGFDLSDFVVAARDLLRAVEESVESGGATEMEVTEGE